jgi:hypothetical protein
MGLTDVLFGRKRLKDAKTDPLYALSTGGVTLEFELGLKSAGRAAVTFKPQSSSDFVRAENELQALLETVAQESRSRLTRRTDEFGYEWLILEDEQLEDLVAAVHLVGSELQARGFGGQLLAAVFRFDGYVHPVYLIYGYKRGAWWPFIPTGEQKERDNAKELELKAKLEGELPIEPDLSRWLALFDAPV